MKSISLALTAVASLAAAVPQYGNSPPSNCISQSDAQTLVARYAAVIAETSSDLGSAVKTAKAITAQGYTEQSDSANIELGIPLGAVTVPSKHAFVAQSQTNPPVVTDTQNIYVACNVVIWEWNAASFGNGDYPIQGIHVFTLNDAHKLAKTHFEFNSFAGGIDTGYTIFYPNGTQFPE